MSIDLIGQQQIREGQLLVNLSEPLIGVPGVNAQNRQNYAQDLQISVRGFGARSSFGVRGVRLYADGIPGTMPDGQGQFSNFDLGSADRIEVLRGPFSALYGNSSGGVISIFTEDAPPGTRVDTTAEYGSFETQRYALEVMRGATWRRQPGGGRVPVCHRRLSRSQRGRAQCVQRQGRLAAGRCLQPDADRQCDQHAERAGSAGTDPRAARQRSRAGRYQCHRLQHAQVRAAGAGRRSLRAHPERQRSAQCHDLRRRARHHAVPGDPKSHRRVRPRTRAA